MCNTSLTLQTLNMAGCRIKNQNLPIGKMIAQNTVLTSLDLSNNKLGEVSQFDFGSVIVIDALTSRVFYSRL